MPPFSKWIVAHRGNHLRARENSVEAFESAIDSGVDMIEFDVRRTADNVLVVHHDPAFRKLLIADVEFSALRHYPQSPALLSDVLKTAAGRCMVDVELKEIGYEDAVLREIRNHGFAEHDFVVTSFHPQSLTALGTDVNTGLLVENMRWEDALDLFHCTQARFLAPDYAMIPGDAEIPILPWTVNDPAIIRRLFRLDRLLGVITDRPADALALRNDLR